MKYEIGDIIHARVRCYEGWQTRFITVTKDTKIDEANVLAVFKPIGNGQYKKVVE